MRAAATTQLWSWILENDGLLCWPAISDGDDDRNTWNSRCVWVCLSRTTRKRSITGQQRRAVK